MPDHRGFAIVALHRPKTLSNVGSALRAVGVYGAAMLVTDGQRYRKTPTDVWQQYRHTPLVHAIDVFDALPYDCVPVAVDFVDGARPLHRYTHPERAFYIFGPEDGTLEKSTLSRCHDVVFVETPGRCMNLSAAVNVVLYDREAKYLRRCHD
jgi:tRNA(Leu) C34 or U34 (ribose-2'-O)-methylase TrmL